MIRRGRDSTRFTPRFTTREFDGVDEQGNDAKDATDNLPTTVEEARGRARLLQETRAVKVLSSGEKEYEAVENDRYRHAGAIRLHNVCLKCHVPNRTSLEDRAAGLVISMPIKKR